MTDEKPKAAPKRPSTKAGAPAAKPKDKAPDVEQLRERRAEIIHGAIKASAQENKKELVDAKAADAPFVPKLDDAGAREQQKASLEADKSVDKLLADEGLEGPPVVAPVLEKGGGTLKLAKREEFNLAQHRNAEGRLEMPEAESQARKMRMSELSGTWLQGDGFPFPGEVIIDIRRADGQDHQRYSGWTEDGSIDMQLPGVMGPGTWLVHAESLVTQVGAGREDHLPLIKVGKEIKIEVTA